MTGLLIADLIVDSIALLILLGLAIASVVSLFKLKKQRTQAAQNLMMQMLQQQQGKQGGTATPPPVDQARARIAAQMAAQAAAAHATNNGSGTPEVHEVVQRFNPGVEVGDKPV
jgi:type II secretory pathway pseudopilin PulG